MLDLSVIIQQLTQGQPPAERAPALAAVHAPQAGEEGAAKPAPNAPAASAPASASVPDVDAKLIAERVYQLMRQELRIQNERRASG